MDRKTLIVRTKLDNDDDFLRKCLLKLYAQQEDDEKASADTHHENGAGFNRADARILSAAAERWKPFGFVMPPSRIIEIRERMLKYAGQLSHLLTQQEIDS